jgi:NAD(P)-dependent dehydrogenase (short-subunit alcohol dehydrogenase family)
VAESLLSGKTALVTGAGVRVGRSIALCLAGAGCDIVIHYKSSGEGAAGTVREIEGLGRRAVALAADLSRPVECRELVQTAARDFGDLDFLVHSASNFHRAALEETTETMWDDSMAVNARAGFLLAREAAAMLQRRGGRIVLVSDLMASEPPKGYLAHAVSKAAVEGLVRALAVELAPSVAVNGVAPGTVLVPEGTPPDVAQRYARKTLLQHNGDPDDVARTVLFLLAGPAFMTGQVLRVDGGQSIR